MIAFLKNYLRQNIFPPSIKETGAVEAYDIWSESYDDQPGNLMLDLDEILFNRLLTKEMVEGKKVADIGCGTGRYWTNILKNKPLTLTGFDVSAGMLARLIEKFPAAQTHQVTDDLFLDTVPESFDLVISTLTVAHIPNIEAALQAWCRILKENGEIIITDFHPGTLSQGGKRTFRHHKKHIAVQNFVHLISTIENILLKNNFKMVVKQEIMIDESMKHYYADRNAMHVYEKYKGFPIIYGLHLKRSDDIK
ncbi:class I SAM-dependent methyltransferase [Dyadobacter frigoris]|uniref:Class I SAM-dependent methyltransferase n=1 Tax=Dyadobacter frigoris TaxID=2576211 RepID=A0A4U6D0J2_9BACT|nr:class I SAM-dependent methyltransferase [Dyadobacter frigoris]TKT90602.1 class I SAM-dependent methyltransferase [Dyadobacter frigoris]GLU51249.1 hypothetical protein Dfri01_07100 [Dyadobacter frigoris]